MYNDFMKKHSWWLWCGCYSGYSEPYS